MNNKLLGGIAAIGLLLSGAANAVPCGFFGVEPTQNCRNGVGAIDTENAINAGGYFGASNWKFLDKVGASGTDPANRDFWTVTGALRGLPAGMFTLTGGIWDTYSRLVVSLQGSGALAIGAVAGTLPTNWSLYELIPGTYLYNWVYGGTRNGLLHNIMNVTIYGVLRPATSVSEPGSVALVLMGVTALMLASRRRKPMRL